MALCLALSLAGCGSSKYDAATSMPEMASDSANYKSGANNYAGESFAASESYEDADYEEAADDTADAGSGNESVASNRKLIKRVNITAETREFEKLTNHIEKLVEKLGGYMESADVYSGSGYNGGSVRHANYTARVPVAKMSELVDDVGENANITNKNESAEDITLQYVDSQSRKEALQVEYDRLMEILKQAEDVDTIVALEQRITEVRYEIQNIESTLRTYDNLVDFATVSITITEVEVYTPEPVKKVSDWERMTEGFMHSVKDVGRGILNFLIGLVIALPYLVVWAVVIFVIFLIVRAIWKGRDKRAEKRRAKNAEKEAKKLERIAKAQQARAQNTQQAQQAAMQQAAQKTGQAAPAQGAPQSAADAVKQMKEQQNNGKAEQ